VPMSTFYNLPADGQKVSLLTHFVVREDAQILYGFATSTERAAFRQLIKISGVGPRTALSVLSGMGVSELAQAITLQEAGRLIKVPGIGKKTAERLLLELKGKLGADIGATAGAANDAQADILQALLALGYSDKEAPASTQSPAQRRGCERRHQAGAEGFDEIKKETLKKIIDLGLPSAMQMLFEVTLFTAAIWLSGSLGKNSQAANQIALTLASSTFMVAMGLSVTAMIRVSHSKGMADFKNMIVVARSIFLLAIFLETIFGVLFVIFHTYLPHLFLNMSDSAQLLDNQEIIGITAQLLLVAAVFQLSDGIQVVVLGALRGLQDVKIPMYITFVAYWLIGFPISFYLGKYTELKAVGIWIGLLAGLSAAALFLYIRFARISRRLVIENEN